MPKRKFYPIRAKAGLTTVLHQPSADINRKIPPQNLFELKTFFQCQQKYFLSCKFMISWQTKVNLTQFPTQWLKDRKEDDREIQENSHTKLSKSGREMVRWEKEYKNVDKFEDNGEKLALSFNVSQLKNSCFIKIF